MTTAEAAAVEAIGLHRTFHRGRDTVAAVRDVSFSVDTGEFVSVEGPSGSGKSTLLHLLAGLDRPDRGTVRIGGTSIERLDETARTRLRRERIGLVLQTFDLLPTLNALDNVAVPDLLTGSPIGPSRRQAGRMLESVGLDSHAHHMPRELSGGEQQRVCIARALVKDPDLVLADEPTAALDTTTSDQILTLLRNLSRAGRTVIIATHDPRAAAHTQRTLRLVDGQLLWPERNLRAVK